MPQAVKHTPGPWTVFFGADRHAIDSDLGRVATLPDTLHPADANLIAAAPEVLDSLKSTLGYVPHTWANITEALKDGDGQHAADCLRCRIDAAIAKAEGR